ncbi:MAG: ORF6N domain-containing protein [Methyloprofundus sp.]|nr:ORF6N domain-containing protein [Methyloprofundus sp.]
MESLTHINNQLVLSKIYTVRNTQVMLDRDLAELYGVETRRLNEQVKRNTARFPESFMFQMSKTELQNWVSQNATSNREVMGLRKQPLVFTEQGVAMLSAVLKSETAVQVSIQIIEAFVQMKRFVNANAYLLERMQHLEFAHQQLASTTAQNFEQVFAALEAKAPTHEQGIFFNGQVFDAYLFITDLIKSAKQSITIIDNYLDETLLLMLTKRQANVKAELFGKNNTPQFTLDLQKHNQQYPQILYYPFFDAHDRFILIDNQAVYHLGASLKDLGKKWFAFSTMQKETLRIMEKLEEARNKSK